MYSGIYAQMKWNVDALALSKIVLSLGEYGLLRFSRDTGLVLSVGLLPSVFLHKVTKGKVQNKKKNKK